ncbi:hypothetical protein DFS34DRAFT_618209 [Phlyctochytrium arcticum]|nr:hypothetical protein DFS34DRAFT_618209 [Phlyctochytrium arcticum]
MELKKLELREKFTHSWYKEPDRPQLPESLCDVMIQVYPNAAADDATDNSGAVETPEACIPANSAVLANSNKYFCALFTNGMAQSTNEHQGGGVDHKNKTLLVKQPTVVKIKGYPLPIVQYFIGFLYNSQHTCTQQESWGMEELEQVLQIADEFEHMSLFDNVSIALMAEYLQPNKAGLVNVILLLKIAYKYSRETSELLRKGCISFCTDNYHILLRQPEFTEFLEEFACRDLALAMTLTFQAIVAAAEDEGDDRYNVCIPIVGLDEIE